MPLTDKQKDAIYKLWRDPKTGFNIRRVWMIAKKTIPTVTQKQVREVIEEDEARQRLKKPKTSLQRHFLVKRPYVQWQLDSMYFDTRAKVPKGQVTEVQRRKMKKFLICVDVFSKYLWVIPEPSLTASSTLKSFKKIIADSKKKPMTIYTDKGTEFKGVFSAYCKRNKIHQITAVCLAPAAEQVIRSFKELAEQYRKAYKANLTPYIEDIVYNYNH